MSLVSSAKIAAASAVWRLTGLESAGRVLVGSVATGDENSQALAGVLLVKAGERSVPLITEALTAGAASTELVDVLASIGGATARNGLERVASAPGSEITISAQKALKDLDEIDRHQT